MTNYIIVLFTEESILLLKGITMNTNEFSFFLMRYFNFQKKKKLFVCRSRFIILLLNIKLILFIH